MLSELTHALDAESQMRDPDEDGTNARLTRVERMIDELSDEVVELGATDMSSWHTWDAVPAVERWTIAWGVWWRSIVIQLGVVAFFFVLALFLWTINGSSS